MKTDKRQNLALAGLFLLVIGMVLFAEKIGVSFPEWLFSWEMIVIAVGCYIGIKKGCRGVSWLVLIATGGVFLLDEMRPDLNVFTFVWPVFIIAAGIYLIIKALWKPKTTDGNCYHASLKEESTSEDVLNSITIFSGVKKIVLSKNFQGGDMVSCMGGIEINLSQADIQGPIQINVTQVFSGIKIIVPPHWVVKSELVSVMGGFQDRRPQGNSSLDPNKVLIIKGLNLLGGIDIKSY